MKKIIALCLLFLQFLKVSAQRDNYIPFPSEMIQYGYVYKCLSDGCAYGALRTEIKGDTVINGMHYSKYYHVEKYGTYNVNNGFPPNDLNGYNKLVGGIRNDLLSKRVYVYFFNSQTEQLFYDFNLHVGDTLKDKHFYSSLLFEPYSLSGPFIDSVWVYRIDSLLLPHDGLYHKRFHFKAKFHPYNKSLLISSDSVYEFRDIHTSIRINPLVEGLGPEYFPVSLSSGFEYFHELHMNCLSIDGKMVYENPSTGPPAVFFMNKILCGSVLTTIENENTDVHTTIYPQPSNGRFNLQFQSSGKRVVCIYNSCGACVFESTLDTEVATLDLSSQLPGIYLIHTLDREGMVYTHKLVIDR